MTAGSEHGDLSWQLKGHRAVSLARGVNSRVKGLRRREQSDNNTWCLAMRALSIHCGTGFISAESLIYSVTFLAASYWSWDVHRREFYFADCFRVCWNVSFLSCIVMAVIASQQDHLSSTITTTWEMWCFMKRLLHLGMMASFHFIFCSNHPNTMQPHHKRYWSQILFTTFVCP